MGPNNKCCYKINPNSLIWGKNTWFNTVEHSGEDCCLFGLSSISDSLGVKDYSGVVRNGIHCYNGVFYSCGDQSSWQWITQGVKARNNQLVGSYRCCLNGDNSKWVKTTACPSCSGNVKLTLSPSPSRPSQTVNATITGLSNCDGLHVDVLKASNISDWLCDCTVSGTGCSCQFTAPNTYGTYSYTSLIDKNGDGSYESGETYSVSLAVTPSGGGCTKGCYLLAIGPYIFDVDITPIISTVSAILVIIEIVVLMTIYNRMKHTKRKRK